MNGGGARGSIAGPALDRRGFLRTTAGGSAAIALASLLPTGCSADYPQADTDGVRLETLTAKEYAVVRASAEALLEGVPVEPHAIAVAIDRELAAVGDPVRADFKSMLGLIEHLTILGFRRRTFTELPPALRLRYLRGWAQSRFTLRRGAYQALRGFVVYFAWIQDRTRALTGFEGPYAERGTADVPPVDFGEIA